MNYETIDVTPKSTFDAVAHLREQLAKAEAIQAQMDAEAEAAEKAHQQAQEAKRIRDEEAAREAEAMRLRHEQAAIQGASIRIGNVSKLNNSTAYGISKQLDVNKMLEKWDMVVEVKPGEPIKLPVVTMTGHISTVDGPVLKMHTIESQELDKAGADIALQLMIHAVYSKFKALVDGEAGKGDVLLMAGRPKVDMVETGKGSGLFTVKAQWSEVFGYSLPLL